MQRLSPYNFGASENILIKLFQATWWTLVHILTHPKCVVHCNLAQVHTPRVSFRSLSNHVEEYWCAVMRRFNTMDVGTTEEMLPSYLDENMWREPYMYTIGPTQLVQKDRSSKWHSNTRLQASRRLGSLAVMTSYKALINYPWRPIHCRINYGSGGSPEPGPLNSGGGLIISQK